mgnify:CR=1 FL=1
MNVEVITIHAISLREMGVITIDSFPNMNYFVIMMVFGGYVRVTLMEL